jgi:hypothetical protein
MTRRGMTRRLLPMAMAATLAACQGVPVNMAGTTVTDRAQFDPYAGQRISAEASGLQLLLFIPISVNDRQQRAFEQLRRAAGDRVLGDVTVTESWQWAFVGTVYTTRIDAIAYPRKAANPAK